MRVAITGQRGLIGRALGEHLERAGHAFVPLVRQRGARGIHWDPERGEIDGAALEGFDAVVHLAGEPIAAKRWTPAFKRLVIESREKGTATLARALAARERRPSVLISASAVGYYGDRGADWLDDDSAPGDGFLAEICKAWEAAAEPARQAGIRTVHPRIGIVLSPIGGALRELMRPLSFGVSAQFGDGSQFQSWLGLDDTVLALEHAISCAALQGPFNLATPNPVTQHELVRTLARVMRRPALGAVPKTAARLMFGKEKADALFLAGQRVRPKALLASGFQFRHPELEPLLRNLLS